MKCPKCQYLSFESGGRCRNCGYDFSLAVDPVDLDLPIKTGDEPVGPLADFDFASEEPAPSRSAASRTGAGSGEFPLFNGVHDDVPLVSLPAIPRAPVAVRKASVSAPRPTLRRRDEPELDLEPAATRSDGDPAPQSRAADSVTHAVSRSSAVTAPETASAAPRLTAGAIDLLLLGSIDVGVWYLTMRLAGLELSEIRILPIIPFAAFLAVLNGGYLVLFTLAGGQTIGKMATGIKVINADDSAPTDRVPLPQAVVRSVAVLASVLPAGLGFLPGLFSAEKRALHDRIANTRIVRG
jgi:uncharacterized RDD family membrane protein YckC